MFHIIKTKKFLKATDFPKIMTSSEHTNKSYLATVLFEKAGCGIVLEAHPCSSLKAGQIVLDLDMEYFKDYDKVIYLYNDSPIIDITNKI